jgi:precorrin-3B C17-methyltransferase
MRKEMDRCKMAIEEAQSGETVSIVSSGDAGIYGMAGLILELVEASDQKVPVSVIPGVTAASAVAAQLGAPLMLDYASISLSDLLVPWDMICKRLKAVAAADLVTVLYNPRSKKRVRHLDEAVEIFRSHRSAETPVGIGRAVGSPEEEIVVTTLEKLLSQEVDMRCTVIIGNSQSKHFSDWFVTPRGYQL